MSDVLLAGDLTARDPGDDAVLRAFARCLPQRRLTLLRGGGDSTDPHPLHNGQTPRLISVRDRRALIAALRRCQVLVLGDGTLRGAGRRSGTRDALAVALAAKALGRRVALLGVGAGELHRGADRMRVGALVRLADLLVLRDATNADVLAAAGAPGPFRIAADPAWCGIDVVDAARDGRDGLLVILDAGATRRRGPGPDQLAAALDRVAARGLRVRLSPWQVTRYGADDLDLARAISARMGARPRILLPAAGLTEARAQAAGARVVLTLRLHGLIVAAAAGTPAVAVATEHELASLSARLGQTALPPDTPVETWAQAIEAAAEGAAPGPAAIRAEQDAARDAFRLLRLLLDAELSDEDHDLVALPLMPDSPLRAGRMEAGIRR